MGQARHPHQKHSTLLTDTKIILATCPQLFHNIRSTRSTPAVVNDCVPSFLSPQMSTSGLSARSTKPLPRLLVCTNFPISDRLWCKWPPGYQSTVCTWTPQVLHLWAYCHLHVTSTTTFVDTTSRWETSQPSCTAALHSDWLGVSHLPPRRFEEKLEL